MLLAGKVPEHGVLCLYEEEFVCRASLKIIVFRTLYRNFNFSFFFFFLARRLDVLLGASLL